jgi:hypothetical protein
MKNKTFLLSIIFIMLVSGSVSINAQNFSRTFNMDYPVYGIDLMGYTETLTMRDLTLQDNFIGGENRRVTLEEAALNKRGDEYTITLLLHTGLSRTARLKAKFKSDTSTGRNILVHLALYDIPMGEIEQISFSGREIILERLISRYVELLDMFYNRNNLLT